MRSAAIITAAGSGERMGAGKNKILLPLNGKTVLETALEPFSDPDKFQKIVITYSQRDKNRITDLLKDFHIPILFVQGGKTRQESVYLGLKSLVDDNPGTVLIHDAARPWVSKQLIERVLLKTEKSDSAVPVIPSINAMKKIDESGKIIEHLQRISTVSAQTPQGFVFKTILQAHKMAEDENYSAIDDTELWDKYFDRVSIVVGDINNTKITYKKDLDTL